MNYKAKEYLKNLKLKVRVVSDDWKKSETEFLLDSTMRSKGESTRDWKREGGRYKINDTRFIYSLVLNVQYINFIPFVRSIILFLFLIFEICTCTEANRPTKDGEETKRINQRRKDTSVTPEAYSKSSRQSLENKADRWFE